MAADLSHSEEEARRLISKARRIVLATHRSPDADAVGSLLALTKALRKLGKTVLPVMSDPLPESLAFLSATAEIQPRYEGGRELTIEVPTHETPVASLRYLSEEDALRIIVTPRGQPFRPEAVRVRGGQGDWDLLIVLDTPSLDYVGDVGLGESGSRPVIVIDHHPTSERFGTVNLIDREAASTSEILLEFIRSLGDSLLDPEIATALYAGLLGDTDGFQNRNTTSRSLRVASELIAAGANHQQVAGGLLRESHDSSILRLWGHALASLRVDRESGLAWSKVSYPDLVEEGKPERWGSGELLNRLLRQVKGARLVALLSEPEPGVVRVSLRVPPELDNAPDASELAKHYGGGGHAAAAGFQLERTTLDDEIARLIPALKRYLREGILPRKSGETSPEQPDRETPASEAERTNPRTEEPEVGVWKPGS